MAGARISDPRTGHLLYREDGRVTDTAADRREPEGHVGPAAPFDVSRADSLGLEWPAILPARWPARRSTRNAALVTMDMASSAAFRREGVSRYLEFA